MKAMGAGCHGCEHSGQYLHLMLALQEGETYLKAMGSVNALGGPVPRLVDRVPEVSGLAAA